jgi:hypothetical protein
VTESHLHPNIAEKMRNELAETMLNTDMLHLMKSYRDSLSNGKDLDRAVELLEQTSIMIFIHSLPPVAEPFQYVSYLRQP